MGAVFLREDSMDFSSLFCTFTALFPLRQSGVRGAQRTFFKQLPMKKNYSLREPYDPPKGEVFMFQTGISMLVAFSLEEIDDPEMGPDLTPREDIRTDIL